MRVGKGNAAVRITSAGLVLLGLGTPVGLLQAANAGPVKCGSAADCVAHVTIQATGQGCSIVAPSRIVVTGKTKRIVWQLDSPGYAFGDAGGVQGGISFAQGDAPFDDASTEASRIVRRVGTMAQGARFQYDLDVKPLAGGGSCADGGPIWVSRG